MVVPHSSRKGLQFVKALAFFFCIFSTILFSGMVHAMNMVTLENGLLCIFDTRRDSGVVAIQVWVKVGSKYEDEKIAGITHFIEHLIFKGTEKMKANEMAARIEALGGSINAYTSYDNTVYHIVVPARSFEEGLHLLVDAVVNPHFPEEEIVKEKKVILEEIKMGEDDPQRKLFKDLFAMSYKDHPYGRPIIGYDKTVKDVTRQTIRSYFASHYLPENMALVVVGDFDEKKALEIIRLYKIGDGKQYSQTVTKGHMPDGTKGATTILRREVRESYLAYSYPIPPITHPDMPALEIFSTIMSDGESSRLVDELKNKKGVVSNISMSLFTPREEGLALVYATFFGEEYGNIITLVDKEMDRMKAGEIPAWELEKAKNIVRASYIYAAETVQGQARQIGNFQTLMGDARFIEKYLKLIDDVTIEDVRNVLNRYIIGKEKNIAVLLPEKKDGKKGGKKTPEKTNPHTFTLKNGLKYSINKNAASPSFAFRVGFVGGLGDEPKDKNGLFNILSRMLLKGTSKKDAATIAREIDILAGEVNPYGGRNIFGLSGKFLSKDKERVMELLAGMLTDTVMKEEDLTRVKEEVLSSIRRRDDDHVSLTFRRFNEALYRNHPYSRDPIGRDADVKEITVKELQKFYRKYVTAGNTVVAFSGDVDEKEIQRLMEKYLSKWSGPGRKVEQRTVEEPKRQTVTVRREIKQAHMVFGFLGPGLLDNDRYAVEVLDALLSGMGGRIHRVLREENPYAYSATFFNQMTYDAAAVGVYVGTDNKFTGKVEKLVIDELQKIVTNGFSVDEVERAKNYLTGNHYISIQSNGAKATSMCLDSIYGFDAGFFKVYPKHIEKVTKDDVNRVAKKYLRIDRMITVVLGPGNNNNKE